MNVDWWLTTHGRIARIVIGSLLIILGLGIIGGFIGVLLLLIGAVPIASAAYGTFLLGPLFGRDIRGRRPSEQPADEEKGQADDGNDGNDGEAREDETETETGGARRGEEKAEEPQEQLEEDASGEASATRDESSGDGRRERAGSSDESSGDGKSSSGESSGSTGAPPLARAERPPGQGPRTKDVSGEGSGSSEDEPDREG